MIVQNEGHHVRPICNTNLDEIEMEFFGPGADGALVRTLWWISELKVVSLVVIEIYG